MRSGEDEHDPGFSRRQLSCPFCSAYGVTRLYLASLDLDSCECVSCAARWDEARASGELKGSGQAASVLIRRA